MATFDITEFNNLIHSEIIEPLLTQKPKDIYSNTLDPFSALLDCMLRNIKPDDWKKLEKGRKVQKTLQNKIGSLHEITIGCFDGYENLAVGGIIDIVSDENKIIAEIKNKHNTTKGNHKKDIYDDIHALLEDTYAGYTGYYVEVLPKSKAKYNKPFTPPDNVTKTNRPLREDIRIIDGLSFYELVSGDAKFIQKLYETHLPDAIKFSIEKVNAEHLKSITFNPELLSSETLSTFFEKAFEVKE